MKKILFTLVITLIYIPALKAQTENCYEQWYKVFEKYGAQTVRDGENEVIISVVKNFMANCYMGMIEVKGGKLVQGTLRVQKEDGSYVEFDRGLSVKYANNPDASLLNYIHNGMTPTYLSSQDESVTLFFIKSLNKKEQQLKVAPKPGDIGYH